MTPDDKAAAVALYLEGNTMAQLAKLFRVSTMTIQRVIKAAGVSRPRGRRASTAQ